MSWIMRTQLVLEGHFHIGHVRLLRVQPADGLVRVHDLASDHLHTVDAPSGMQVPDMPWAVSRRGAKGLAAASKVRGSLPVMLFSVHSTTFRLLCCTCTLLQGPFRQGQGAVQVRGQRACRQRRAFADDRSPDLAYCFICRSAFIFSLSTSAQCWTGHGRA